MRVSEQMILVACQRNDIALLHRWGRRGVRVQSARPLVRRVGAWWMWPLVSSRISAQKPTTDLRTTRHCTRQPKRAT
jgi:hypothetical protein